MKRLTILDSAIASISSVSIDCRALNRTKLSDYTCGKCLDNFLGDSSTKTACVPKLYAAVASKSCPKDCSSSGVCQFLDINTRNRISSCNLQSSLCVAKCVCNENTHGDDCSISNQDHNRIQEIQKNVLTQLKTVASVEAPSPELLLATMSSTASLLSSNTHDLSDKSIELSRSIVSATMKAALSLDIPVESLTVYNSVIDGCIDVSTSKDTDESVKANIQSLYENYVDTIGKTAMKNSSSSSNITITTPNMQITVNKVKPINTISSLTSQPSHELCILSSSLGSHQSVYDRNIPLLLSVTRSNLYDTSATTATSNSSANTPLQVIASNPLRVQLDCSLVNSTQIRLVLQNSEKQSFDQIPPITKPIRTTCLYNNKTEQSYMCEYTDMSTYNITVKCDGSKNITYITECPNRLRSPSCGVLSDVGKCSLVSFNSEKMICSCDICSVSDMSRRRLSLTTMAYQVAGVVEVVYGEFISVSSQPMSKETVERTLIVLLTYALVWIIIVVSVPVKRTVYQRLDIKRGVSKTNTKVATVVPADAAENIALETRLREYINIYLPKVYKEDQSYIMRLITQIVKNHLYLNLFLKSKHDNNFLNYMEAFKVLTVISSSMFILIIIYSAQYPSDDGSCAALYDIDTCLSRKIFRGREYCAWENDTCIFNAPEYSVFEEIFLAWIQLVILAPISALTSYAFDKIILAPTSTYVQDQLMVSHGTSIMRRISQVGNGLRRVSLAVGNQARRLGSVFANKVSDGDIKKRALSVRSTILVDQVFLDKRRHALDLLQNKHHPRHDEFKVELEDATDFDIAQAFYQKFTRSFSSHRKHLSETDKTKFDNIWAPYFPVVSNQPDATNVATTDISTMTDENTNTLVSVHNDCRFKSFSSLLFSEMLIVQEKVNQIHSAIKDAPTHIVGAELIKLLLIDLIGRDSKEAKIFETSFESNIKTTKVVSIYFKVLMILVMIGLNIYFVYTSMLYCSDKDYEWQIRWMSIFITTLGIDISFNYMSEAYLLSFIIPMTINSKIGNITTTTTTTTFQLFLMLLITYIKGMIQKRLNKLVNDLVSDNSRHHHHHHHLSFSTPNYFFLSTNLARRFKDIPESVIVLAYSDHMPYTSDHNNHINSSNSNDNDNGNMVLLSGIFFASFLKAISVGLVQITALPEFAQVPFYHYL